MSQADADRLLGDHLSQAEQQLIANLASQAGVAPAERARILDRGGRLVAAMRARASEGGGVEQFLQQYRLSTPEGVALLCLAEAFLRVPDTHTVDELIRDKLSSGDWSAHLGRSQSALVNTSTFGLMLTQHLLRADGVIGKLLAAGGEPLVRKAVQAAMKIMAGQFVMGHDIESAVRNAAERPGFRYSFDMLGEGAKTAADARRYFDAYLQAIRHVGEVEQRTPPANRATISVKLSALHARYETAQADRAVPALVERLVELSTAACAAGLGLTVDAEEADRLELSLRILRPVALHASLRDWTGFGLAIQAYQKRARAMIDWAGALAAERGALVVRLVKGAYWDTEIKRAQERGLPGYPVFTRKAATDVSYLACARALLSTSQLRPAFATHNALTVATILEWAGARRDFEFQRLHGMGEGLYEPLLQEGHACRIYAPVGPHQDLLAYLVRRLLENGANTSFVHQLADEAADTESLLADPVDLMRQVDFKPHPRIALPVDLYLPERQNSAGLDLHDRVVLGELQRAMSEAWERPARAVPLIGGHERSGVDREVVIRDPADRRRIAGLCIEANAEDVELALDLAQDAASSWSRTAVEVRAGCLERAADLLEEQRDALMALAVREAGKTIPDALAEVREAADFCRYYAAQARNVLEPVDLPGPTGETNQLRLIGRGPVVCISPWNFPLAIFMGQVSAALVAGNTVLAKPAPQTPLMAFRAVRLLHEAGVPPEVVQLLTGGGDVGQALVGDARIRAVAFTGSTNSARSIARALAERQGPIVPLIAETGGQNAMIVDSSALPEQVVNDVLVSGFQSAGQRCSALRVLWLQEEIAPRVLEMLQGAMDEWVVGDPASMATDVGPVIDEPAKQKLEDYLRSGVGKVLHRMKLGDDCDHGVFVAPTLLSVIHPQRIVGEAFGPIVHVVTWEAGHLEDVVKAINRTGYGLTLGVHSRIGRTVEYVRERARVGNVYVNRSMIGAVVGVQPFGGEGLSGTGPKAGGPHYIQRFTTERTVTIDTTSAGGNATLMSL